MVKLVGDSSSLERHFKKANSSAKGFNKNMTGVGRTSKRGQGAMRGVGRSVAILGGGYLGATGLIGAVRSSWQEMAQSAKVTAQTNAVIKSTGGVANVSAKRVGSLAEALLAKSGIDDETIRSGENMLLTFRGIRNEAGKGNKIFDQTAKAVLDLDVAMTGGNVTQESLRKKAILVGKAMQDPIKGLGSLRRVGIQFTKAEEAKIKALVESGNIIGAQKLILGELNKEVGGSAAALGKTLTGRINIARESFRNLGGALTEQLVPALTRGVNSLNKFLGNAKNKKAILDGFKTTIGLVSGVLRTLRAIFNTLAGAVGGSKNAIKLLIGVFVAFKLLKMASHVAGVASSFFRLGRNAGTALTKMKGAKGAAAGLRGSLIGKAGLVGGVLLAGFALSKLIRKIPGWETSLRKLGGAARSVAEALGLVNDPGKQFKGKTVLGQQASKFLRQKAARLQASGLTARESAQRIVKQHPKVALRDAQVLAGVFGSKPQVVTNNYNITQQPGESGPALARRITEEQRKAAKRNTVQRRGAVSGR